MMDEFTREKRKLRRHSSHENMENDEFMEIIQNLPVYPYKIINIRRDRNRIYANLALLDNVTKYNYMDNQVREICFVLAEILRDHTKKMYILILSKEI